MTRRTERVNDLIREELSQMIARELNDPRVQGIVSITEVNVSPDLRQARVHVSVLGDEEQQKQALQGLRAARGFMRRELLGRLAMKHTPDLEFVLDHTIERAARVLELMKDIEPAREP
jgi:ribosome-binding factor A